MADYYTDILNVYVKYYNKFHNTNKNLFSDIDDYEGTNNMMEEFYEHLYQFSTSDEYEKSIKSISDVNPDEYDGLYALQINDEIVCVCSLLFPILDYIAQNVEWCTVNWDIMYAKIK